MTTPTTSTASPSVTTSTTTAASTTTTTITTASSTTTTTITTTTAQSGPPNFSALAQNQTASPVPSSSSSGVLCSGANVQSTQSVYPVPTGAYNYNKIALSNNPGQVFEVECYMNPANIIHTVTLSAIPGNSNTQGLSNSLEYCMDLCNQANNAPNTTVAGPCAVAQWIPNQFGNIGQCILFTTAANGGSPLVGQGNLSPNQLAIGARYARLLTTTAPRIVDYTSLLPPSNLYNLGLCGGSNSANYNATFYGVYSYNNTIHGASRQDLWLLTCLGYTYLNANQDTALSTATAMAAVNVGTPQTADDCARLCDFYTFYQNYDNTQTLCKQWTWTGSTCNLYSTQYAPSESSPTVVAGIIAAGFWRGYGGNEYTQAGYKRWLGEDFEPGREHARDTLSKRDYMKPDAIIPWGTPNKNPTRPLR
ncbi:hypothetical protein PV11_05715 [Exophiala sideris]|uniref:Uncharacterized protein n=1 Tax=Exophiala sideris TaxID=1016849 RepID=A0A0D1X7B3_9EURO|nr:hypothetical protein PV11_05715 [Exophiala sideris]